MYAHGPYWKFVAAIRMSAFKAKAAAAVLPSRHDGQISKTCPALRAKIFRFSEMEIRAITPPSRASRRGRNAFVT